MSPAMEDAVTTFVGYEGAPDGAAVTEAEPESLEEQPIVDFELDVDSPLTATVVNSVADTVREDEFSSLEASELDQSADLTSTVVNTNAIGEDNLEFDVKLTDSVFLGQPMMSNDFDIGSINLDLSTSDDEAASLPDVQESIEPVLSEPEKKEQEPVVESPVEESAPVGNEAHWEEVNTKLDLAKAYEEMGDLEGARELLQEVVGEGPDDLVAQAQDILGRIGE